MADTAARAPHATAVRLYGRRRVLDFVTAALTRRGAPARPLPVLLLTGPRGSGGTALLGRVRQECGADCLTARLDLAAAQGADDAVLAAMRGLADRVPGIRPVRFPRMAAAVKALTYEGEDRQGFDGYLRAARRYAQAGDHLDAWAERAAPLLATPGNQFLTFAVTRTLTGLLGKLSGRQEKAVLDWFAGRLPQAGAAGGYQPLWYLRNRSREAGARAAREVARTLCAALLADLAADFHDTGLLYGERVSNALLLIDNADGEPGRQLLDLITECRRENHDAGAPPDPLVVVAVRRGPPPPAAGEPLDPGDERLAFPPDALTPAGSEHPLWWCPVRLGGLALDDVTTLCRSHALGSGRRDADFLHAVAAGHPAATADLGVLLAGWPGAEHLVPDLLHAPLPAPARLPSGWPVSEEDGMTACDHLVRRLLPELLDDEDYRPVRLDDHPLLRTAAVCAATPGMLEGAARAALHYLDLAGDPAEVHDLLGAGLWLTDSGAGALEAHPLIALLLRHLTAREEPRLWNGVHTGYAAHYGRNGEEELRLLHTLALVDRPQRPELAVVTAHMTHSLDELAAGDWIARLRGVTAAPNRSRGSGSRETYVTRLAGPASPGDRDRVVARLLVAGRLHGDRTFDPGRALDRVLADEFDHLASLVDGDSEALYRQARLHRRAQSEWEM